MFCGRASRTSERSQVNGERCSPIARGRANELTPEARVALVMPEVMQPIPDPRTARETFLPGRCNA